MDHLRYRTNRRTRRGHFRKLVIGMALIISPFFIILLWNGVENFIQIFHSEKQGINFLTAEKPFYVEEGNGPKFKAPDLREKQKNGEFQSRVYPYSVVKGGVYGVQELRSAIWRDPVVAKHYSNFKLDQARIIEAKEAKAFHVSYRIGQKIFWTKKKLKIAKGERFITDGMIMARTRCANMISEVPRGKTSPDEPTAEVFDTPLDPLSDPMPIIPAALNGGKTPTTWLPPSAPLLFASAAFVGEPASTWLSPSDSAPVMLPVSTVEDPWPPPLFPPDLFYFVPPIVNGNGGPPGTTSIPSDPPAFIPPVVIGGGPWGPGDGSGGWDPKGQPKGNFSVPEPGTFMLLGSGLLGLIGYGRFRK